MKKIRIEGVIDRDFGDVSAKQISEEIEAAGPSGIELIINSVGGSAWEGIAMYNELKEYDGKIIAKIRGIAASAATMPMMAADEIIAETGTTILVHGPWNCVCGNAADMRSAAESLEKLSVEYAKIYGQKVGYDLAATWVEGEYTLTPQEALEAGLVDKTIEAKEKAKEKTSASVTDIKLEIESKLKKRYVDKIAAQAANLTQEVSDVDPKGDEPMGNEQTPEAPLAATPDEIKALCPKADAEWVLEQVIAGATKEQVLENYAKHLEDQIEGKGNSESEMKAKLEDLEKELEEAKAKKPIGAQALEDSESGNNDYEDPVAESERLIKGKMESGLTRMQACASVYKENPELHKAVLENGGKK
jgi:ATP-dependent Clp protease protease subunit